MKKFIAKIHLWLSLPIGIVLTIVCLSGAALVFEGEITRARDPQFYRCEVPEGAHPLRPSQLVARIGEQVNDSLHLTSLQIPASNDECCLVAFRETGRSQLSVDPYTGKLNGWTESPSFFRTMRKLHRWLLDPPATKGGKSVGKTVVGVSTLLLVVILLSGLILWIPRNRKTLCKRLKVSFAYGRCRFWYDCHVSLGFYATLLLMVMALTGLTWSFGWYRTAAYTLFGAAQQSVAVHGASSPEGSNNDDFAAREGHERGGKRSARTTERQAALAEPVATEESLFDYGVWDEVLAQLVARYPGYKTIVLTPAEAQVGRQSAMRRMDRVLFDSRSGRLREIVRYEDMPRQQRLRGWFYAFHTGSWGGVWTKILYFLAALIGATLPLTGYYLWWKQSRRKKQTVMKTMHK